jgi:predicted metal-binding membrane protein
VTTRADSPRAVLGMAERRVAIWTAAWLTAFAAVAWYLTARQATQMAGMVTGLGQVGGRMANNMAIPLFLAMWLTMMIAMMFPTVVPMVLAHRMVVRKRGEGALASVAFVAGYLVIWTASGAVPLAGFVAFRNLSADAATARWISLLAGGVLAGAGLYQFTPWKGRCLRSCRSPLGFIFEHDFGGGWRSAVRAGISHGLWCLGCCWALMAVLLIVGLMNLAWMGALSLVFLAEKNWRHGVTVARLAGTALFGLGLAVIAHPSLLLAVSGVATHAHMGGGM